MYTMDLHSKWVVSSFNSSIVAPDTYDYAKLIILLEGVVFVSLYSSILVISTTLI